MKSLRRELEEADKKRRISERDKRLHKTNKMIVRAKRQIDRDEIFKTHAELIFRAERGEPEEPLPENLTPIRDWKKKLKAD